MTDSIFKYYVTSTTIDRNLTQMGLQKKLTFISKIQQKISQHSSPCCITCHDQTMSPASVNLVHRQTPTSKI